MPSDVTALIQRLLERVAAADPVVATQLGMSDHLGELPDYSPAALAAVVADVKTLQRQLDEAAAPLKSVDGGGEGEALAAAIDAVTGGQIARRVVRLFETRRVQDSQPTLYLDAAYGVLLLMIKEIGTPQERVAALAGRLRALPAVLEQGLANLREELPLPFVEAALGDVPGMRELAGSAAPAFVAGLGFEGAVDAEARLAAAALERFGGELRDRFLPRAVADVAAGRDLLVEILEQEYLLEETPSRSPHTAAPPWSRRGWPWPSSPLRWATPTSRRPSPPSRPTIPRRASCCRATATPLRRRAATWSTTIWSRWRRARSSWSSRRRRRCAPRCRSPPTRDPAPSRRASGASTG